jgi:SH3-like domain-containing protein
MKERRTSVTPSLAAKPWRSSRVTLSLALTFTLSLLANNAAADSASPRRKTTATTTLRAKPGEKEAKVAELPLGTELEVLSEQGRWLRVRARGGEGFVARTVVEMPLPELVDPRAWSSSRKGDADQRSPDARLLIEVTATMAVLRAEPKPTAPQISAIAKGGKLTVIDVDRASTWTRVRDGAGNEGWVARDEVGNGSAASVVVGGDAPQQPQQFDEAKIVRRAPGRLALRADFGLGLRILGMELTSNATGGLTNYLVDAQAAAFTTNVEATWLLAGRWFVTGDGRLQLSLSSPGIDYPGPTSAAGKIPFKTAALDAGGTAGLRTQRGFSAGVRLGVHYDAFLPDNVDNLGRLPREALSGVTVGVRAELVPMRSRISAAARFDVLAAAKRSQTNGLEDGPDSTASGWWGGLQLRYLLSRRLSLFTSYDFGRATTSWRGMSARQPGVTDTHRTDSLGLAELGLTAEL